MRTTREIFLREVWKEAATAPDLDPAEWRRDAHRRLMRFSQFGQVYAEYGWTLEHIVPLPRGGRDIASNCRALHISRRRTPSR